MRFHPTFSNWHKTELPGNEVCCKLVILLHAHVLLLLGSTNMQSDHKIRAMTMNTLHLTRETCGSEVLEIVTWIYFRR
jgi:hypothetical protein